MSFKFVQGKDYFLSGSGTTSSATSITLTSFTLPDGVTLITMADFGSIGYATLEPETTNEENISFTGVTQNGNGTATLTGVTRGLGLIDPYTANPSYAEAHAGGTRIRITNNAPFYNELAVKQNDETITGSWDFTAIPTTSVVPTANNEITNKLYVDQAVLNALVLDPTTTAGDMIIRNAGNVIARLPIGSAGQYLRVSGGIPTWQSVTASGIDDVLAIGQSLTASRTIDIDTHALTIEGNSGNRASFLDSVSSMGLYGNGELTVQGQPLGTTGTKITFGGSSITADFGSTVQSVFGVSGNSALGTGGGIKLFDADDSNFITLRAPAVLGVDTTYTLPSADGTSGQALTTNGSGTLTWATVTTATPGIDSVLAVGQALSASRIVNINGNSLTFTNTSNADITFTRTGGVPIIHGGASSLRVQSTSSGNNTYFDLSSSGINMGTTGTGSTIFSILGNTSGSQTGAIRLYNTTSANYVAFAASTSLATNVTWTLPTADGSSGQSLTTNGSGTLSWTTFTPGMTDPMSTAGDIIIRNGANTTTRLGIGSAGQVLTVSGGVPSWQPAISTSTIYTGDGTLSGARVVTTGGNTLTFQEAGGTAGIGIQATSNSIYGVSAGNSTINILPKLGSSTSLALSEGTGGTPSSLIFTPASVSGAFVRLGGNATTRTELRLNDSSGSLYIGLIAPTSVGTTTQYILPSTQPTAGQVLTASAPVANVVTTSWGAPSTLQYFEEPSVAPVSAPTIGTLTGTGRAIAIGDGAVVGNVNANNFGLAIGQDVTVGSPTSGSGDCRIAIGQDIVGFNQNSVVIGSTIGTVTGTPNVVVGYNFPSIGNGGYLFGDGGGQTVGNGAVLVGSLSGALGGLSAAVGSGVSCAGSQAVAIGLSSSSSASNSVAIGTSASASADAAVSIGLSANNSVANTIQLGGAANVATKIRGQLAVTNSVAATSSVASFTNSATTVSMYASTASPESVITATRGSMCMVNTGAVGQLWFKTSGTGNTGWTQVI